jgi:DNA-binding transcriptional regulator YiaG
MSEIPQNPYRKFWMNEKGEVFQNLLPGGESLLAASACLLPSARETRKSILRIRREFKLSRAQLAVCLGVGKHTLRRWESGERSPSHAGRRLIQLVQMLFFAEDIAASDFGAVMIGRIDLKGLENAKRALLPDSIRRLGEGDRE